MLAVIATIAYTVVLIYFILLLIRLVLDWVQFFSRNWKPTGPVLLLSEVVYTATDPPLNLFRRFIPPLKMGRIALDLSFLIVVLLCWFLLTFLGTLAS